MDKNKVINYVMNSPYNTNKAVLEGLLDDVNGSSETILFEESITTAEEGNVNLGIIPYNTPITANTIVVTFDDVEYTCYAHEVEEGEVYIYGGYNEIEEDTDFSTYPFAISSIIDSSTGTPILTNTLITEVPGTHSIKVKTTQESTNDLSTANVTFINNVIQSSYYVTLALLTEQGLEIKDTFVLYDEDKFPERATNRVTVTLPLYKGKYILNHRNINNVDEDSVIDSTCCTGQIQFNEGDFIIMGDSEIALDGSTNA